MLLAHTESVLLRYLYTCRLGTVGVIKEDLVQYILLSANAVLGCFFSAISATVMRHNRPTFAYCCGNFTKEFYGKYTSISLIVLVWYSLVIQNHCYFSENSPLDENLLISDRIIHSSFLSLSFAIHVILGWKILTRKRSLAKINVSSVSKSNNSFAQSRDTTSALFGNVFYMIYVLIPIPVIIMAAFMGDVWVVIIRYILGLAFVYVAPALAYVRNGHVRTVLGRELAVYMGR